MASHTSSRSVSLTALTSTVLPLGVLVVMAFLAAAHIQILAPPPDLAPAKILDWYRMLYTARVTVILLTPQSTNAISLTETFIVLKVKQSALANTSPTSGDARE